MCKLGGGEEGEIDRLLLIAPDELVLKCALYMQVTASCMVLTCGIVNS